MLRLTLILTQQQQEEEQNEAQEEEEEEEDAWEEVCTDDGETYYVNAVTNGDYSLASFDLTFKYTVRLMKLQLF